MGPRRRPSGPRGTGDARRVLHDGRTRAAHSAGLVLDLRDEVRRGLFHLHVVSARARLVPGPPDQPTSGQIRAAAGTTAGGIGLPAGGPAAAPARTPADRVPVFDSSSAFAVLDDGLGDSEPGAHAALRRGRVGNASWYSARCRDRQGTVRLLRRGPESRHGQGREGLRAARGRPARLWSARARMVRVGGAARGCREVRRRLHHLHEQPSRLRASLERTADHSGGAPAPHCGGLHAVTGNLSRGRSPVLCLHFWRSA